MKTEYNLKEKIGSFERSDFREYSFREGENKRGAVICVHTKDRRNLVDLSGDVIGLFGGYSFKLSSGITVGFFEKESGYDDCIELAVEGGYFLKEYFKSIDELETGERLSIGVNIGEIEFSKNIDKIIPAGETLQRAIEISRSGEGLLIPSSLKDRLKKNFEYKPSEKGTDIYAVNAVNRLDNTYSSKVVVPEDLKPAGFDNLLEEALSFISSHKKNLIIITGEKGTGKTRFLNLLIQSEEVGKSVSIRGYPHLSSPFKAVKNLFAKLRKEFDINIEDFNGLNSCQREELELLFEFIEKEDDEFNIEHSIDIYNGAVVFFRKWEESSGTVIAIDDVHRMDPASKKLVSGIIENTDPGPIFAVTDHGNSFLRKKDKDIKKKVIRLKNLEETQTYDLIDNMTQKNPIPFETAESIKDHSAGNPLYLKHAVLFFYQSGNKRFFRKRVPVRQLTQTSEDLIKRRLSFLDKRCIKILAVMSLLGETVNYEYLKEFIEVLPDKPAFPSQVMKSLTEQGFLRKITDIPRVYRLEYPKMDEMLIDTLSKDELRKIKEEYTLQNDVEDSPFDSIAFFLRCGDFEKVLNILSKAIKYTKAFEEDIWREELFDLILSFKPEAEIFSQYALTVVKHLKDDVKRENYLNILKTKRENLDSENQKYIINLCELNHLLKCGNIREADSYLKKIEDVPAKYKDEIELIKANIYNRTGKNKKALKIASSLTDESFRDKDDLLLLANICSSNDEYKKARSGLMKAFSSSEKKGIGDPDILESLGRIEYRLGNFDQALTRFQRAVRLLRYRKSDYIDVKFGALKRKLGCYNEALKILQDINSVEAHIERGFLSYRRGELKEGLNFFKKAQHASSDNPTVIIGLTLSYLGLSKYESTERLINRLNDFSFLHYRIEIVKHFLMAEIQRQKGREDCLNYIERALNIYDLKVDYVMDFDVKILFGAYKVFDFLEETAKARKRLEQVSEMIGDRVKNISDLKIKEKYSYRDCHSEIAECYLNEMDKKPDWKKESTENT